MFKIPKCLQLLFDYLHSQGNELETEETTPESDVLYRRFLKRDMQIHYVFKLDYILFAILS